MVDGAAANAKHSPRVSMEMEKKMEHEVEEMRPQLTEAREQVVEVNRKLDLLLDRAPEVQAPARPA